MRGTSEPSRTQNVHANQDDEQKFQELSRATLRHRAARNPNRRRQLATKTLELIQTSALFLAATGAAFGQIVPDRYIVELAGDSAAVAAVQQGARFAARESGFAVRRAAVRQGQTDVRRAVADHGGTVVESMDTVLNALIVTIPDARAAELLQIPGVRRVHAVRRLRAALDHALPLHQVPAAWAALPLGQNSAGAGIKIGMVDSGIDVNNPAFSDPLPPVPGFPQVLAPGDLQFTNAKVIVAKNYTPLLGGGDPDAADRVGHGTGTSMAAAGGPAVSPYGPIVGVAPKAYLGSYKVLSASGTTTDVIVKAVDDAVADGMDVINISIGGYVTSYSDVDPSDPAIAALEAATQAGVVVTVSAGNDGPGAGTIQDLASAPDVIAAGAISNDRALGYAVRVSGANPYEALPGTGPAPSQPIAAPLWDAATVDGTGLACAPLPAGSAAGMVVLISRGSCTFESKINDAMAGGAVAAIVYNNAATGLLIMDVGSATLPAVFIAQAGGTDLKSRIAAAPGLQATLDFSGITAFPARPDLTDFSSRGPSIGRAMKPDLVAVGDQLVTAAQDSFPDGELYDPSGFVDVGGTSYSAPLTAGAAAILKAARPGLTVQQYRSLLINSAGPATSGPGVAATVQQAGAGVLNVAAALGGTVAAYPTSLNFGTGQGAINQTLNLMLTNIGSAGDTYSIAAVPSGNSPGPAISSSTLQLDANASQQIALSVSASGLGAGEYQGYVQVSGAASQNTATIPYWFAVPGSTPAGISVLYADSSDAAGSRVTGAVVFRVVDAAGLPFGSGTPKVAISAGGGSVRSVYQAGDVPGTYAVDLRAGTSTMQIDISVGNVTQSVLIPVV